MSRYLIVFLILALNVLLALPTVSFIQELLTVFQPVVLIISLLLTFNVLFSKKFYLRFIWIFLLLTFVLVNILDYQELIEQASSIKPAQELKVALLRSESRVRGREFDLAITKDSQEFLRDLYKLENIAGYSVYSTFPLKVISQSQSANLPQWTELQVQHAQQDIRLLLYTADPLFDLSATRENFFNNKTVCRRLATVVRFSEQPYLVFGDFQAVLSSRCYSWFASNENVSSALQGQLSSLDKVIRNWKVLFAREHLFYTKELELVSNDSENYLFNFPA